MRRAPATRPESRAFAVHFAQSLAHDSNNLLATLRVGLELLQRNLGEPELRTATFSKMERALDTLAQINRRLILYDNHVVSGRSALSPLPLLIEEVLASLQDYECLRDRNVRLDAPDDLGILVDGILVRHAVLEMLIQTADAAPAGHAIHIRAGIRDEEAFVEVHGDGSDISGAPREAIAEPAAASPEPYAPGSGSGMVALTTIAATLGGSLKHTASASGGSSFRMAFPPCGPRIRD